MRPVIFLSLLSLSAHAATPISWDECVRNTVLNNPELKSARESVQSSDALHSAAHSGFLPQITGNLGYSYGSSNTTSSAKTGVSATSSYTSSLNATQNLFSGFQDWSKIALASANRESSQAAARITEAKVLYDLKSAYHSLQYAQDAHILAQEIFKRREENLRLVELRFQGGRENKGSVLLSEAYLEQAKLERLQSNNLIASAQQELATVLGMGGDFEITGTRSFEEPPKNPSLQQLAVLTPEHTQSVAQENAALATLKQAQSGFYPALNLTGALNRTGTEFFPSTERWSVGLNLSVPLFSGGKDLYGTRSSAALYQASSFNLAHNDAQLLARLQKQYAAFLEATQKKKVDEAFFNAAFTRAQIARQKYNAGLISFDDWDVIENDLTVREKSRLVSRRDWGIAEAAWQQSLGKGFSP